MRSSWTSVLFLGLLELVAPAFSSPADFRSAGLRRAHSARQHGGGTHWVDTWTAMPQLCEATNLPNPPFNQSGAVFVNSTIRQTLHTSIGADTIRIRISNAFGNVSLPVTSVTVAYPAGGVSGTAEIDTSSLQTVTFSGNASISIVNGGLAVSDPLNFRVEPQSEVAVTMYLADGQQSNLITAHPGSRATTFYQLGDALRAQNLSDTSTQSEAHWYFLSAVEAWAPAEARGFAIVGDSITDGRGSDTDGNDRWPDLLLARMQNDSSTASIAVLNQAAGGNRILADGLGPAAVGRIERDVLAQNAIRYAMIFEGVNDIGDAATDVASQQAIGDALIQAYEQIITRVHTFGIPMFAATITPFGGNVPGYSDPQREETRQRINGWIRDSGKFEEVLDFDAVVRNNTNPNLLAARFDSGDGLHPNVAGYEAIAKSINLGIFEKWANGVNGFQ